MKVKDEGKFSQKLNFSHFLVNPTPRESGLKFQSLQNISGVSQQNSVAAVSEIVDRDLF